MYIYTCDAFIAICVNNGVTDRVEELESEVLGGVGVGVLRMLRVGVRLSRRLGVSESEPVFLVQLQLLKANSY